MEAFIYAFFVLLPLFLFLTNTIFVRLEWRGVWRGKKVQIIRKSYKTSLLIDGEEVCTQRFSKKHINSEFEDSVHGTVSIFMHNPTDMMGNETTYQL